MKAIGFTNGSIKRLYLMKYLGLSVVGGAIGLGISLPLTRIMSVRVSEYIILSDSTTIMIVTHDVKVAAQSDKVFYVVDGNIQGELKWAATFLQKQKTIPLRSCWLLGFDSNFWGAHQYNI